MLVTGLLHTAARESVSSFMGTATRDKHFHSKQVRVVFHTVVLRVLNMDAKMWMPGPKVTQTAGHSATSLSTSIHGFARTYGLSNCGLCNFHVRHLNNLAA